MANIRTAVWVLMASLLAAGAPVRLIAQAQNQGPPARSAAAATAAESVVLTNGWAALAQNDLVKAEERARQALLVAPLSVGARALLVEIGIARGGIQGGMAAYLEVTRGRTTEPQLLRRLAQALLYETAFDVDSLHAIEALRVLGELGDEKAKRHLDEAVRSGGLAEVRLAASLGDPAAVERLAAVAVRALPSLPLALYALGESRHPAALPAIRARISDPMSEVRGAAVEALGRVAGKDAAGELKAFLMDQSLHVRLKAATALYHLGLGDGDAILDELARSPIVQNRLAVAQAWASRPADGRWLGLVQGLIVAEDPSVQLAAAKLLRQGDPAVAAATLDRLSSSSDRVVATEALRARISAMVGEWSWLGPYLTHGDRGVAVEAARAILADGR